MTPPPSRVEAFLRAWHSTFEAREVALLAPWISDAVVLLSPAVFKPFEGKEEVTALLADVLAALAEYRITRAWVDGGDLLLEFDGKVGALSLQGIDRITLDDEGKIAELRVFIRPFKALVAVMTAVVERQIGRLSLRRRIPARVWFAVRSRL
jgi:hypothetical protein